ncbi:hypothetical protein SNA_35940 [Streptomyces natalensis ATCC 27448]|uniref:Uncharacterized protein n=1 Tax=Streptomyces natalensis ATCC 27448 TaxID=1240678 RepID=A0A0D7CDZ6_9ACTN|nr:hypothetical protein SNA_35940 [Streptomyces natalensis ATCC 27448]
MRTAAAAGDTQAALAWGRLLCLTAAGPAGTAADGAEGQTWPEEPWLRAVLRRRPRDVPAMTLLAGRLAQQIDYWENMTELNPSDAEEFGEDEATIGRRRAEAADLLARIRAAAPGPDLAPGSGSDPGHRLTRPGLAELAAMLELPTPSGESAPEPPHDSGGAHSFYVLEDDAWSGSVIHRTTIVAARPDELRWACDQWFRLTEGCGLSGSATLSGYAYGEQVSVVDLAEHFDDGRMVWTDCAFPPLPGAPLPPGLPVPGRDLFYGFAARVE